MPEYSLYYELSELLEQDVNLIPAPVLYDFDPEKIYAAMLDRLAQPLNDGSPSPFSSRSPLSAEGQLMSAIVYLQDLLAHEINLIPDLAMLQYFRMLGVARVQAEYPSIELKFTRTQSAIANNQAAFIPLGTQIRSRFNNELVALTTSEVTISTPDALVSARLNRVGKIPNPIRFNEFTVLPRSLAYLIESVTNTGKVLYEGRNLESLVEMVVRSRNQIQRRGDRCVTARDFYNLLLDKAGAEKVNVIPRLRYSSNGQEVAYDDVLTIAVYPNTKVGVSRQLVGEYITLGTRWEVRPARIIPINGTIKVKVIPSLLDAEALALARNAIAGRVNPPNGKWGDPNLTATVAEALEREPFGFYSVPEIILKHAQTNVPLSELEILPGDLLEIQSSINFIWVR